MGAERNPIYEFGEKMRLAKMILHYVTDGLTRELLGMVPDALVVDNGSPRPFPGAAIRNEDLGFTRGWNRALGLLYDEYDAFLLMNSDIRMSMEQIEELRQILVNNPDIGLLSGACNSWHPSMRRPWRWWLKRAVDPREVPFVEMTAPLIRKDLLEAVGFFDEALAHGYGVDYDFGFRAWQAGFRVCVWDSVKFCHLEHGTIRRTVGFKEYHQFARREMERELLRKYGPRFFDPSVYPFWMIGGVGAPRGENCFLSGGPGAP